jgi:hypothetical protein
MRSALAALLGIVLAMAGPVGFGSGARAAGPLGDWAAVIVSGDFHAHSGAESEAFDNARRDVSRALVAEGFSSSNMQQFSVRPERYPDEHLMLSEPGLIGSKLRDIASRATGGCLVYFTSHGSPSGVLVGPRLLSPAGLSQIVDDACGDRPTVVIVSACFSGVFVPPLSRPDRMVLTAARPDRSSFGCGESDRYPYFDACMLETLPHAGDFAALGRNVQICVASKEKATGMAPPSEPQFFLGSQLRPLVPFYPLIYRQAANTPVFARNRAAR